MSHAVDNQIKTINEIDEKKLIRKNLGDASFTEFEPIRDEVKSKIDFIGKFHSKIEDGTNNQVNSHLSQINSL